MKVVSLKLIEDALVMIILTTGGQKLNSCDVSRKLVTHIIRAVRAGYLHNFIRYRRFQVNLLLLLILTTKASDSLMIIILTTGGH